MNFDLVAAIIAAIRGSSVGALVGGRIYAASQVPADAAFPRCYVSLRNSPQYARWSKANASIDRHQYVEVIFASTNAVSSTPFKDVEAWDKLARTAIEDKIVAPNLIWFQRVADTQPAPQANDLTTYTMAGGLYDAFFEEG